MPWIHERFAFCEDNPMEPNEIRKRLLVALREVEQKDTLLLANNLSERCIASRLAMYLQKVFPEYSVDVEYNRKGELPKTLELPPECANYRNNDGEPLVIPDVIVHQRGPEGPNILVLELKKTTNRDSRECDHRRIQAFRRQLGYSAAALIDCETRPGHAPTVTITEWL
jgi:hypothetical protein